MDIYRWLFIQNKFKVAIYGYFLFARVNKQAGFESAKLSFDLFLEKQDSDCAWVDGALMNCRKALDGPLPSSSASCAYCQFVSASGRNQQ
jgi:hypothetical protein